MLGSWSWALLPAACLGFGGLCLPPDGQRALEEAQGFHTMDEAAMLGWEA